MSIDEAIARGRAELAEALRQIEARLAEDRSRARAPLVRQQHEIRRMLDPGYAYSSQAGQDRVVDRLMGGKPGVFADIGGYDGVTGSNTLFLEQRRGWTGVLVEPVPAQLARATAVRRCPCLPYAVAAGEGRADFVAVTAGYTQMSGLAGSYDAALLDRVRADPRHAEERIEVETRSLSTIFDEAGIGTPDFVSLDIEGGELAALEAFDFDRHRVALWAIENNAGSPDLGRIMRETGHDLVEFCGPDELWRRRA